jgi:hypothetical protein
MSENRYAVLIGNSTYPKEPKLPDLRCPASDVDGLAAVLQSPSHGQFAETVILKDRSHFEVMREIHRVLSKAGRNDLVLLYYSGHGKLNRAGRLYLATHDTEVDALEATAVPVGGIRDFLEITSSNRVVFVLDCCFSGAAGQIFKSSVDDQLQMATKGRGTYVMTASTGIQVAQEKESDQYSLFTKHLIAGIESGDADRDGDGLVTVDELYDYVHDRVLEESPQEPTKWGLDVRGDLAIARSGRQPRLERARLLRPFLIDLVSQERVPDSVLATALPIIRMPLKELTPQQKRLDALLDELHQERIGVAQFILKWARIEAEPPAPPPPRPEATPSEPPRESPPVFETRTPSFLPDPGAGAPLHAAAPVSTLPPRRDPSPKPKSRGGLKALLYTQMAASWAAVFFTYLASEAADLVMTQYSASPLDPYNPYMMTPMDTTADVIGYVVLLLMAAGVILGAGAIIGIWSKQIGFRMGVIQGWWLTGGAFLLLLVMSGSLEDGESALGFVLLASIVLTGGGYKALRDLREAGRHADEHIARYEASRTK